VAKAATKVVQEAQDPGVWFSAPDWNSQRASVRGHRREVTDGRTRRPRSHRRVRGRRGALTRGGAGWAARSPSRAAVRKSTGDPARRDRLIEGTPRRKAQDSPAPRPTRERRRSFFGHPYRRCMRLTRICYLSLTRICWLCRLMLRSRSRTSRPFLCPPLRHGTDGWPGCWVIWDLRPAPSRASRSWPRRCWPAGAAITGAVKHPGHSRPESGLAGCGRGMDRSGST